VAGLCWLWVVQGSKILKTLLTGDSSQLQKSTLKT